MIGLIQRFTAPHDSIQQAEGRTAGGQSGGHRHCGDLTGIASRRQQAHDLCMTERATHRPATFTKPAHWSSDPLPQPSAQNHDNQEELSPTRYGDWVKNGIAIDF
ncbi:DUF1674 domain-containing protein [Croceibacterium xixiisoli]